MREEELIERLKELKEEGAILGEDEVKILLNLIENSVSKDSIRKKIDILEEIGEYSVAHYMKELLEE